MRAGRPFQRRQPLGIHADNVHATDLIENRAILGHDDGIHREPIPQPIRETNIIAGCLLRLLRPHECDAG